MSDIKKIKLVNSFIGAIVLTLLMQVLSMVGYGQFQWMLFLPMVLFFALGADFKKLPSMVVCYLCGVGWAFIAGVMQGLFAGAPAAVVSIVPTIITIFCILTIHDNFLSHTIFGNIPCLFLGMCSTFFVFMMGIKITPLHLIAFFLYGLFLSCMLVLSGMLLSSLIFGKERVAAAFGNDAGKKADSSL